MLFYAKIWSVSSGYHGTGALHKNLTGIMPRMLLYYYCALTSGSQVGDRLIVQEYDLVTDNEMDLQKAQMRFRNGNYKYPSVPPLVGLNLVCQI